MDARGGATTATHASVDERLTDFPLRPDDRWGYELDGLHRVALPAYGLCLIAARPAVAAKADLSVSA